jgi:hypothetical protein
MGMLDEIYCYSVLPDGRDPRGTCFQTKSFPDPSMCRYRITSDGRLIDSAGNDLEPDGYITFYTVDREDGDGKAHGSVPVLREYRARFCSAIRIKRPTRARMTWGRASRSRPAAARQLRIDHKSFTRTFVT